VIGLWIMFVSIYCFFFFYRRFRKTLF